MVCLGFEPRAAGWKAQSDPLSYGGTPISMKVRLAFRIWKCFDDSRIVRKKICHLFLCFVYFLKFLFLFVRQKLIYKMLLTTKS